MTVKPLYQRLLIEVEKIEEKTKGGIIIPQDTREREQMAYTRGIVRDIGEDIIEDCAVKIGDKVVFAKYGGFCIDGDNGEDFRIINEEDLVAKIVE